MHNFKPGDLALIVMSRNPQNIGKVVELISFHPADVRRVTTPEGRRFANLKKQASWVVKGELLEVSGVDLTIRKLRYTVIPPHKLMPLRGDEQTAPARREELTV